MCGGADQYKIYYSMALHQQLWLTIVFHASKSKALGLTHGRRCTLQETWLCFHSFLLQPTECRPLHTGQFGHRLKTHYCSSKGQCLTQVSFNHPQARQIALNLTLCSTLWELWSCLLFSSCAWRTGKMTLKWGKRPCSQSQMVNEIRGIPETSFAQFSRSIGVNELRHIV